MQPLYNNEHKGSIFCADGKKSYVFLTPEKQGTFTGFWGRK